ncbi:MAG: MFS transporter [Sphingomonadaceae bacterium]|nr:MFS transporter [Sphingomonadaceae bacterium]
MTRTASPAAALPSSRSEFATGWPILLGGALGTGVTGVHFQVVGAMLNPLHTAYGWSRGDAAFALTIATVVMSFVHVPVGILVDRFGPKPVLVPGSLGFGLGVGLLGLAGPTLWSWYAAYAVFSILVVPASAFVWMNAIARHFVVQRGLALALALVGSGVLTAIIPGIVLKLVGSYGVRGAYFVMAAGALALTFPFALLCIPREMGGAGDPVHAPAPKIDRRERWALLLGPRFWRIALAVALVSIWIGTFSVHFQPMLTDAGLTPAAAAKEALFLGVSFLVGALGTGILFDRFNPRLVAAGSYVVPAIASALLLGFHGGFAFGAVIALLVGVGLGAPVNVLSYASSYYFELRHYGFVLAALYAILAISIGIGSALAGSLFDATGSYQSANMLLIVASLIAGLLLLSLRGAASTAPQVPAPAG